MIHRRRPTARRGRKGRRRSAAGAGQGTAEIPARGALCNWRVLLDAELDDLHAPVSAERHMLLLLGTRRASSSAAEAAAGPLSPMLTTKCCAGARDPSRSSGLPSAELEEL
eukprot:CAMPEP_0177287404 /NCGR_PEP_ID=MMETSP0367-20130122/74137_1 /TAXON_ID=447022 ORGANISM="Scrippsiella hangoei-like, Strain SHHI-4" /NCGR_SAMPLE_ID=MMETSP0367 /ASSEMBLY_ACC=CAM_ASM_000362 /LENGTH=110 /DNA_ID=CAMNT_0018744713 /DNA_START=186 /DNA_END=518 /DNA_ORIENTATION=+